MRPLALTFKAGEGALKSVQAHGFDITSIGTIAGASGGAKWLVLSQIDRVILGRLMPQLRVPVHLIGSSIGSWRFACYAQDDPLAAIDRFENAYIDQTYTDSPDVHEITAKSRVIMREVLGDDGARQIVTHPLFRTHVMAVRSRHILGSENRYVLGTGLTIAAALNMISRRSLGLFFERALFYDTRERPPFFDVGGFPIQQIGLDERNLEDAVVATGSIPLLLHGVPDIAGAVPGVYRDGGVIDYHHDLPHSTNERLTLFPHFYDYIVPGWFDKKLKWRRPHPAHVDRTIIVSPSAEFVASLPNSKIPDRTDFSRYTASERVRVWRKCVAACERLADDFNEVLEKEQLPARLQALT